MDIAAPAAAQPAGVVARSASSRNYQSPPDSRHRRPASGSKRTSIDSALPHRHEQPASNFHGSMATSSASQHIQPQNHHQQQQFQQHNRQHQQSLSGVSRRDHEAINLPAAAAAAAATASAAAAAAAGAAPASAGATSGSRRSSSRDYHQSYASASPGQRREVPPPPPPPSSSSQPSQRAESRSSRQRYSADVSRSQQHAHPPQSSSGRSNSRHGYAPDGQMATPPVKPRARTSLDMPETGLWQLQKTIGAGSMGKVKLARHGATGEQCALKIVPRQSNEEYRSQRERERADHSKDVRTAREAAIVKLLKHPYICGMRDVMQTNHHWYMLFEYVNGGQMLDYIISHGRLKEKQARKFARQIASALDYCHKNSIVHRDLKIENILISKTGDIKIIDFGLSNLYSPGDLLKTFCGSLYFAAPELLQAQHYDGPEVDVWSFGIVLYVLVCGKVPFDDQSMPQLHAKIKKGQVDYPNWLSMECKHLLSRMLVTDRKQRAPLSEILQHPWMNKNYNGPIDNFLPHREPLKLPLDDEIIDRMTGFEFGTADQIKEKLTKIIESERYQLAARLSKTENVTPTPGSDRRRGVFDFYKRRNSTTSRDSVNASTEALSSNSFDPLNAFAKELSIYYLAREKLERERMPKTPSAGVLPMPSAGDPLRTPELAEPKAAYTNASTYEQPGEKPTGGRSRPRARTHGEDEAPDDNVLRINNPTAATTSTTASQQAPKKESMAGGILRRLSTRKPKERPVVRQDEKTPDPTMTTAAAAANLQPPTETAGQPPRRGFSIRKSKNRNTSASPDTRTHGDHLAPPGSANPVARAGARLLNRSSSVNSADFRRKKLTKDDEGRVTAGPLTSASHVEPPMTSGSDYSSVPRVKISDPSEASSKATSATTNTEETPKANVLHRSVTSARTKSLGHARRESMQIRRARRNESQKAMEAGVPEETEQDLEDANDGAESQSEMKPVFLKGLFSVSTTSTKPLPIIRADLIRVMRELDISYNEIKGGFSCRHTSGEHEAAAASDEKYDLARQSIGTPTTSKRRISFHGFKGGSKDLAAAANQVEPKTPRSPSKARGSPSATDDSDVERGGSSGQGRDSSTRRRSIVSRGGPPAEQTTTHVQNPDSGESLTLRFEILVVKVPLFALHGIQFKKVSGGTWSYKEMAQRILDGLRL